MNKGFTLVELLVVLLLSGILLLSAFVSLVPATEALMQVRTNSNAAQKAQFAISRLIREFNTITNVVAGDSTSITYDFLNPDGDSVRHTVEWNGAAGDPLLLEDIPLSDDVATFELRYYDTPDAASETAWSDDSQMIEITLQTLGTGDLYTNRVAPRNI
jgi:prepilin-type N-terminal cleavage/methylation domain-containing protein